MRAPPPATEPPVDLHVNYFKAMIPLFPLALLYLDIDRFKAINDGHGHAGGGDHVAPLHVVTLPDQDAREPQEEAADPTLSVFVTANAGSGKTSVLRPSSRSLSTFSRCSSAMRQ